MDLSSTYQWAIGVLITIGIAIVGLFAHVYQQIGKAEGRVVTHSEKMAVQIETKISDVRADAEAGDKELWVGINAHRQETYLWREKMTENIGKLATREDFEALRRDIRERDDKLMAAIVAKHHGAD